MIDDLSTFRSHLHEADVIDDDYDLAGSFVWKPFGVKLRERFLTLVEAEVEAEGYAKHDFPLLIPAAYMEPQKEHIKSFEDSVCWVTKFGDTELPQPPYLRPTGETEIYTMASKWIRSYRDLPLKVYQTGQIYRPVSGGTPILSGQGVNMTEGHGFYEDEEAALNDQAEAVDRIDRIQRLLGLEGLIVERPLWGNKPVAERNISIDIPMPTGKTRMSAGTYFQNRLYSEAYDIYYDTSDGTREPVRQVTWGFSTRLLGINLLLAGDDQGLRLLPELAPVQAVFVPIKNTDDEIEYCESVAEDLDLRTKIDTEDDALGEKLERWETRGIPVRIEVGPAEVEEGTVTVYRRDLDSTSTMDPDAERIEALVEEVGATIRDDIGAFVESRVRDVTTLDELDANLSSGLVSRFPFCGRQACGESIENERPGELLGTELAEADDPSPCLVCEDETLDTGLYSRRM